MSDLQLYGGTPRDFAWQAWQTAYGMGDGQGADEKEFQAWWDSPRGDYPLRTVMLTAWNAGAVAAMDKAPTFEAWWKMILDTQPVVKPGESSCPST